VIPWIIFAVIVVPLVIIAFAATMRRRGAVEHPATEGETLTQEELAAEDAFEADWREEDKERYRQERLP
jgi:hypothetical protein